MRTLTLSIVALLGCAVACGPRAPQTPRVVDRTIQLEARLASAQEPSARARILAALGRQEEALGELARAIEGARERLAWDELAALWRQVGAIHVELGQVEEALDVFGKRLEAAVALGATPQRASALVDTAYAFALLGYVGRADEAVTEARLLGGEGLLRDPMAVERLGLVAELLNDGARAKLLLLDAAEGHRNRGDEVAEARCEVVAARLAARDEGDEGALDRLEAKAAALLDAAPLARLRRYQAELHLSGRNGDACLRRATEAVALADARGLQPVAKVGRILAARCADEIGRLDEAVAYAKEAGSIVELQLRHVSGDVARQELGFEAFLIYRLLLSLQVEGDASDRVTQAFLTSERARARAHLDAVARSQLGAVAGTRPVPPALARDEAVAEERVRRLTQAVMRQRGRADLAERHRDALWALEDIKESIARNNPLLSRVAPPEPARVADVRALLGDDGALLSYFWLEDEVLAFAIDATHAEVVTLEPAAETIDAAVRAFRRAHLVTGTGRVEAAKKRAHALYEMLVAPVADVLKGKRRLLLVPHGALSLLPFEALVDDDGAFLVEHHDVAYSLSATLAVATHERPPSEAGKAFVGMGDPVYDWASFAAGRAEQTAVASTRALELWNAAEADDERPPRGLHRLEGTGRELRAIAKLFGTDQHLYLRAQASEENVKAGKLAGHRIVHVASHGLVAARYQALALTLKPEAREDGFLMNSEIADLDLDADLVVLSACRTGEARRRSAEPIAGLALSLRSAGARNALLSLWSVDDDATAELMQHFYRPLAAAKGTDYAASLSDAKRAMVADERWRHPFFWAAFVLHGAP